MLCRLLLYYHQKWFLPSSLIERGAETPLCLCLYEKVDSVLKRRDITLLTLTIVKAMAYLGVMYGCERWTIKKAEHQRIDAFKLWCWRRFLSIPRTARRLHQSILKEINSEYSLEGLILKLKLQYFGHMMQIADSLETILMLEKTESKRKRGNKRWHSYTASLTKWTRIWANSGRQWRIEESGLLQSIGSQRAGHDLVTAVICKTETGCHWGKTCTKDSLC